MHRLPAELVHMICRKLTPEEVASIRFTGRTVAAVDLEYFVPTYRLRLSKSSFDRLLEVAHHPVVGRCVYGLRHEHDFLVELDRLQWEANIRSSGYASSQQLDEDLNWNDHRMLDWRTSGRREKKVKRHNYSYSQLDREYANYQRYCGAQEVVRQSNFYPEIAAESLKRLSNLTTVSLPTIDAFKRYKREILDTLGAMYDQRTIQSNCTRATTSWLSQTNARKRGTSAS